MALGLKRIETRHWSTAYRGPLAIHAAKRWTADEREFHAIAHEDGLLPAELPLGAIVAVAQLIAVRPTEILLREGVSPEEQEWGNYGPGRFGWVCADIRALANPVPFRGAQGMFDVPDEVLVDGYVAPIVALLPKAPAPIVVSPQGSLFP
ncbi:hypothetical protein BH09PSE4_BH09PSE4_22860 [soil metagenome]